MKRKYVLRKNNKVAKTIKLNEHIAERDDMRKKMMAAESREVYKMRSRTVEPVIGDIKENRGFLSFLTRGLEAVKNEFNLVCFWHNLVPRYWNSLPAYQLKKDILYFLNFFFFNFLEPELLGMNDHSCADSVAKAQASCPRNPDR